MIPTPNKGIIALAYFGLVLSPIIPPTLIVTAWCLAVLHRRRRADRTHAAILARETARADRLIRIRKAL